MVPIRRSMHQAVFSRHNNIPWEKRMVNSYFISIVQGESQTQAIISKTKNKGNFYGLRQMAIVFQVKTMSMTLKAVSKESTM